MKQSVIPKQAGKAAENPVFFQRPLTSCSDKRKFLEQYRHLSAEIDCSIERLAEWRSFARRTTINYSDKGSSGRQNKTDRIQTAYDKIETLSSLINQQTDALVDLRIKIEQSVSAIPDCTLRIILWQRYIFGNTWEQIGEQLHYSSKQITRLHLKALQLLELQQIPISLITPSPTSNQTAEQNVKNIS